MQPEHILAGIHDLLLELFYLWQQSGPTGQESPLRSCLRRQQEIFTCGSMCGASLCMLGRLQARLAVAGLQPASPSTPGMLNFLDRERLLDSPPLLV